MPHHNGGLGGEVVDVQGIASGRLVDLSAYKDHLTCAHTMLEGEMLIPIPMAPGPGVATRGHGYFLMACWCRLVINPCYILYHTAVSKERIAPLVASADV